MHNLACSYVISAVHNIRGKSPIMSKYFVWSLHWIEFGDMSLDVVEAVFVCPSESVSPHELVQITRN
jgi:hypothetical protein